MSRLLLASQSPRRRELLQQLGENFEVCPVDVDESGLPDESADTYVLRVARLKADAAALLHPQCNILASDTAVYCAGQRLGKPRDEADAKAMLRLLSGKTHEVYSSVCLRCADEYYSAVSMNRVSFRALSADEIDAYWLSGEPLGKAGAYAIQGRAAAFIAHLDGSYSGVMGLPLFETAHCLARCRQNAAQNAV